MSKPDFSPVPPTSSREVVEDAMIPLLEEHLAVGKRTVETGTVRLHKHTEQRTETIEVPLTSVHWQVEHVPINRVVAEQPRMRQEGDTTIYPVMEERVTLLREFVLVEEVHVTRRSVTTTETSTHLLKREQIAEERLAPTRDIQSGRP